MDVHQVVESITVLAIFNAIGCHPSVQVGATLGLYGKHCAHVDKLNLKIWYNMYFVLLFSECIDMLNYSERKRFCRKHSMHKENSSRCYIEAVHEVEHMQKSYENYTLNNVYK